MLSPSLRLLPLLPLILPFAASAQTDDDPLKLQPLTVTGSRLARDLGETAGPVTQIDRDSLLQSGSQSLGSFLQSLPMMSGAPIGTSVGVRDSGGGFSRGIESVELRGLGARRTLVLLNGRRFIAGGNGTGGVVDLAMMPLAMIERIEILKDGASVEYGADAVAGVVNVITRQDMEGLQLRASGSVSGQGDAETGTLSAVFGRRLGAAQITAGVELFDQQPVSKGARGFSSQLLTVQGEDNRIVPDGSSAPPFGNFRVPSSGDRLTLIEGENGDSPEDFRPWISRGDNNDRFNFNPFEDLLQSSRRQSAFVLGHQDFGPQLKVFTELLYQQRDSFTRLAPLPFFTSRLDGVTVAPDNLYNPFGEEITDARRRLVEGGTRGFAQDNAAWRLVIGANGLLEGWRWDASLNQARNQVTQRQFGDLLRDRVALALGPSHRDDAGRAVCGSAAAPVTDCVPLNLFGGPGSISPEMLAYTGLSSLTDRFENEQAVFSANLSGDLTELPTGPLAAAFGYEYRDEQAEDIPDAQTRAGNTTGAARAITRGRFHSQELYAEFGVPLMSDRRLDLDLGLRGIDFSRFASQLVFDTAVRYAPSPDIVLRASWGQSFRAPTVGELFGGLAQSNPAVDDPCADFSQLGETEIARCVDQGVPADGSFDQTGNETPQLGGGNPDLRAEDAASFGAGLKWTPQSLPGLLLSLDYYAIRIDDGIASLGANTILQQCLATGEPSFCERIDRAADGNIVEVRSELQNIASETARGLDLEARYGYTVAGGRLQHRLLISHVLERELKAFPNAAPFVGEGEFDPDSFGAIPRWKGRYTATWLGERLDLAYAAQWIGALNERGGEIFPGTVNRVGARIYHDLSLGWTWPGGGRISLGVDNLLDRDPPFLANGDVANTDVSTYRLLGRSFRMELSHSF